VFTFSCGSLATTRLIDVAENDLIPIRQPVPDVAPDLKGGRILVVEDVLENQLIVATLLRKAGARVDIADNGRIAVDKELGSDKSEKPEFDVILMDMQMPVMDGYEATRILRASGCRTPIVALTAHALSQDRERCLAAGCSDYDVKPIDRARLLRICWRWMQQLTAIHVNTGPNTNVPSPDASARVSPVPAVDQSSLPVIDSTRLRELDEAAGDIIRTFLEQLPKRLLSLRQAVGEMEVQPIQSIAHLLKGSAANMGLLAFAGACSKLVVAAREHPETLKDNVHDLLQDITTEAGLASEALKDYLSKLETASGIV